MAGAECVPRLSLRARAVHCKHSRGARELDVCDRMVKKGMPTYQVETPQRCYAAFVERGVIGQAAHYIPPKIGKVFVVTTEDVWLHAGARLTAGLAGVSCDVLHLPGGEEQKRLAHVEQLAGEMLQLGADRSRDRKSVV